VTGVQTCALPIWLAIWWRKARSSSAITLTLFDLDLAALE
jgi:hypothetical protein